MTRYLIRIGMPLLYAAIGFALVYVGWPPRITFTWQTASEIDTAAFLVYRSDSPAGPFERLTQDPIAAQGDPLAGASYHYDDRDVTWGAHYYYQLEEVERDGARNLNPDVARGKAGAGWPWALVVSAILAILGGAVGRRIALAGGRQSRAGDGRASLA
jgi:hypothetical protein